MKVLALLVLLVLIAVLIYVVYSVKKLRMESAKQEWEDLMSFPTIPGVYGDDPKHSPSPIPERVKQEAPPKVKRERRARRPRSKKPSVSN